MARKLKNMGNEKYILQDLDYGEKIENHEKYEKYTVGPGLWRGK